jgi:CheY-like chemotaxis protein
MIVSDTGMGSHGVPPARIRTLPPGRQPVSREHGGLGLGLAISRHIVEMHGGTIEASSAGSGRGATFVVKLPAMLAPAGVAPEPALIGAAVDTPRAPRTRLDGIHVVAVDDDSDALEMVREILEAAGAEVITAQTGEDALGILKRRPPQVLVCDIGMPGMDGFELIGQVRQMPRTAGGGVPAAALTAYARSEDRTRALRAGFQMHLAKPIDPDELVASVKALASWDESLFERSSLAIVDAILIELDQEAGPRAGSRARAGRNCVEAPRQVDEPRQSRCTWRGAGDDRQLREQPGVNFSPARSAVRHLFGRRPDGARREPDESQGRASRLDDATVMSAWCSRGGKTLMMPRWRFLLDAGSVIARHRGQLSVPSRARRADPSIYGPSATRVLRLIAR